MNYWYLASPYSKYPAGREAAFRLAVEARGLLIQHNVPVFSPIVHSHPVAEICDLDPTNHNIWLPSEEPFRRTACGMIILCAENWADSFGISCELRRFISENKPIVKMQPGQVPIELL